jgi:hypothetical protein
MKRPWRAAAATTVVAVLTVLALPQARADVFGSVYLNNAAASHAVIGFTHGAADLTLTVPSPTNAACTGSFAGDTLCFRSDGQYTVGEFLASGGATVLTGSSHLSDTVDNAVFEFTGTVTVTTGEMFQAGHDDGLQLQIGSMLVIDAPGPTGFTTTPATYTGPSGTFAFDLVYGECCGPPAALGIALPLVSIIPGTPEPETWALLATGLAAVGAVGRRRRQRG